MQTQAEQDFINKISIILAEYEEERKKRLRNLIIAAIIILIIAVVCSVGTVFFYSKYMVFLMVTFAMGTLIAIGYLFVDIFDRNKEFKRFLKQKCQKDILKTFQLKTLKGKEFSEDTLIKSNLFANFNKYEYDDIIMGTSNDVEYKIAETKLISEGNRNELTAFKGVIISFKSNKKIKAETLITTKGDINIRNYPTGGNLAIYLIILSLIIPLLILAPFIFRIFYKLNTVTGIKDHAGSVIAPVLFSIGIDFIIPVLIILLVLSLYYVQKKKMQDVKLESVSFEKRFNVYTKDQLEARYLITPSFMTRLQDLETAFGTRKIKCSFFDDQIMFAIPTRRDLFELGSLFKPLSNNSDIKNFYKELTSIQQMVDHFKLTEKTGL